MKKFYIGQKVQIVRAKHNPELIGTITHVIGYKEYEGLTVYEVDIKSEITGNYLCGYDKSLKPVYDGDEPSTWNECAWKPKLKEESYD